MQILKEIELKNTHRNNNHKFKVVDSITIDDDNRGMTKAEKQKEKNERIKKLMKEYNELCFSVKGRKPNVDELIKAKNIMFELRELRVFDKIRRM